MPVYPIKRLEPSQPSVAAEIHRVMIASYRVEAELLGVADFPPLRRTPQRLVGSANVFFGVAIQRQLAGVVELDEPSSREPTSRQPPSRQTDICSLVVHPDFFRSGVATALLEHVVASYGARDVTVSTGVGNEPALALYTRHGFQRNRLWNHEHGIAMVSLVRTGNLGKDK